MKAPSTMTSGLAASVFFVVLASLSIPSVYAATAGCAGVPVITVATADGKHAPGEDATLTVSSVGSGETVLLSLGSAPDIDPRTKRYGVGAYLGVKDAQWIPLSGNTLTDTIPDDPGTTLYLQAFVFSPCAKNGVAFSDTVVFMIDDPTYPAYQDEMVTLQNTSGTSVTGHPTFGYFFKEGRHPATVDVFDHATGAQLTAEVKELARWHDSDPTRPIFKKNDNSLRHALITVKDLTVPANSTVQLDLRPGNGNPPTNTFDDKLASDFDVVVTLNDGTNWTASLKGADQTRLAIDGALVKRKEAWSQFYDPATHTPTGQLLANIIVTWWSGAAAADITVVVENSMSLMKKGDTGNFKDRSGDLAVTYVWNGQTYTLQSFSKATVYDMTRLGFDNMAGGPDAAKITSVLPVYNVKNLIWSGAYPYYNTQAKVSTSKIDTWYNKFKNDPYGLNTIYLFQAKGEGTTGDRYELGMDTDGQVAAKNLDKDTPSNTTLTEARAILRRDAQEWSFYAPTGIRDLRTSYLADPAKYFGGGTYMPVSDCSDTKKKDLRYMADGRKSGAQCVANKQHYPNFADRWQYMVYGKASQLDTLVAASAFIINKWPYDGIGLVPNNGSAGREAFYWYRTVSDALLLLPADHPAFTYLAGLLKKNVDNLKTITLDAASQQHGVSDAFPTFTVSGRDPTTAVFTKLSDGSTFDLTAPYFSPWDGNWFSAGLRRICDQMKFDPTSAFCDIATWKNNFEVEGYHAPKDKTQVWTAPDGMKITPDKRMIWDYTIYPASAVADLGKDPCGFSKKGPILIDDTYGAMLGRLLAQKSKTDVNNSGGDCTTYIHDPSTYNPSLWSEYGGNLGMAYAASPLNAALQQQIWALAAHLSMMIDEMPKDMGKNWDPAAVYAPPAFITDPD